MPRSSTKTLISALDILARDIQSADGVANAAIAEAAQRLREQNQLLIDMNVWFLQSQNWVYKNYFENRVAESIKEEVEND